MEKTTTTITREYDDKGRIIKETTVTVKENAYSLNNDNYVNTAIPNSWIGNTGSTGSYLGEGESFHRQFTTSTTTAYN